MVALRKYDMEGNLIASYGTNEWRYLKYLGGGYFLGMRVSRTHKYDLIKIEHNDLKIITCYRSCLSPANYHYGGITTNGKNYALSIHTVLGFPSIQTSHFYIRIYDKQSPWKLIRSVEVHTFAGLTLNELRCIDFDGKDYWYGGETNRLYKISQNSLTIMGYIHVSIRGYIPFDICVTEHHIWVSYDNLSSGHDIIVQWDKKGNRIKSFNVEPLQYHALATDGKYLYT